MSKRRAGQRPSWALLVMAGIAAVFFALPLLGLIGRASWSTLGRDLTSAESLSAFRLSLICSVAAAGFSIVLGFPLAWVLARVRFRARPLIRGLVLLPLVLPPVVGGVALLTAFSRRGLAGSLLYEWAGIQLTYSTAGAVLAETFVALPFFVITVEAGLRAVDSRYEEVAATLGASRWHCFRHVTLPLVAPSVVAGGVLAWARALGEFGATITFAGNVEGRTQTLPLAVYLFLDSRPDAAIALSLVLLLAALAVIVLLRERWMGEA
ncbi:MAG: molybdate ABC transporter permease subunit [Acidobacteria bacterium]|nr:MAG: molybdate ABC transporter permease subunit [Acidobacteriota bacterium]